MSNVSLKNQFFSSEKIKKVDVNYDGRDLDVGEQ